VAGVARLPSAADLNPSCAFPAGPRRPAERSGRGASARPRFPGRAGPGCSRALGRPGAARRPLLAQSAGAV